MIVVFEKTELYSTTSLSLILVLNHLKIDLLTILETNKTLHLNYLRQTGVFSKLSHTGKDWNTIDLETRNADNLIAFKKSIVKNNLLYLILDILVIYVFIFFDI